ncbi:hypothetical protein JW711_01265 [Candidatus Woesearchaeota archaeon]|nr:hypothetical protein [Candidatus Woesearchaeota archaeon]
MVGNALEQNIIGLYSDNPSSAYSINQIATKLGKKYPYINKKVTILIKNRIFKKIVVGRSHLCSLNLSNDETIYLLILNEIHKKKRVVEKNSRLGTLMEYLAKAARAANNPLILKQKDTLLFVTESKESQQDLEKSLLKEALKGHTPQILTKAEFLERLKTDKSLHEFHTILHGFEKYYEYIREIEDELKIRYSKLTP